MSEEPIWIDDVKKAVMGRPKKEVDFSVLEGLCRIHCTQAECASVFGVSIDTLAARIREEFDLTFPEYYKQFDGSGKASLRRAQMSKALSGNATMLIWMGKQLLGQRDKIDTTTTDKTAEEAAAARVIDTMLEKATPDQLRVLNDLFDGDSEEQAEAGTAAN